MRKFTHEKTRRDAGTNPNSAGSRESLGCGCIYLVAALLLVVLFPSTRDWAVTKPLLAVWRGLLPGEPPSWSLIEFIGSLFVYALPLVGVATLMSLILLFVRLVARRIGRSPTPPAAWSAAIALGSLIAMILVAIFKRS